MEQLETKGPILKQRRVELLSVALACDRTGVSKRSAAIIASSVLRDVGIISEKDSSSRIQQRDKTLNVNKVGGTFQRSVKMEDHYILLKEPGNSCIGYVTCETRAADNIKQSILQYLKEINDISAVYMDRSGLKLKASHLPPKELTTYEKPLEGQDIFEKI
ncbi:hypothetical protein ILUMI_12448 [Ignelater luminosus]|uniref:Uncharacterized protein n=1 Tax=Ignelater luminosus TaxID=2038154 RepID=A0A8K0D2U0_IGNLU|nr:hypothetical protein ILUMI_12448 [Ignelater luminosus]